MSFKKSKNTRASEKMSDKYGLKTFEYNPFRSPLENLTSLSKVADQRLVRLESYKTDKNYSDILSFAYAKAQRDIKAWSGQDAVRFNKGNKKLSTNQIYAKINDILSFLNAPTSTKQGITKVFESRANTLNEKYPGLGITWKDLSVMYDKGLLDWNQHYGSDSVFRAIGNFRRPSKDLKKKIKAMNLDMDVRKASVTDIAQLISNGDLNLKDLI